MTILETRFRREQQKNSVSILRKEKESLFRLYRSPVWHRRQYTTRPDESSLALDLLTAERIRLEVTRLLEQKPRTVWEVANALIGSSQVPQLYAQAHDDKIYQTRGFPTFKIGQSVSWPMRDKHRIVKRRYDFVNAMNRIQGGKDANKCLLSWKEAQQELGLVLIFPWLNGQEADSDKVLSRSSIDDFIHNFDNIALRENDAVGLRPSQRKWQEIARTSFSPLLDDSAATDQEGKPRVEHGKKGEAEAKVRVSQLMRPLTEEEQKLVKDALYAIGPETDVVAQDGTDSIQRSSLQRLKPGHWLNDEVIHYFFQMLSRRDEEMCARDPSRKRSHFFKSFFFTSLLNEGHSNPALDGTYSYKNVKRWSKKVPGKDIFNLDKIFFAINQGNVHWLCAVIYMQTKKIKVFDSMGSSGQEYLESLFRYLQDEHQDKKGTPLPDKDKWTLTGSDPDTPKQRNSYDCGVFTCMFADFLALDSPLVFDQDHVTRFRARIVLSILRGKAQY